MPKIITLSLFNRPKYTIQVLDNLALCKGVQDYRIIPVIDVQQNSNNVQVMYEILLKYQLNKRLNIDSPRVPDRSLGCNTAIFTCLNTGFLFTDFLIHVEDDILLAPDALQYFEWANEQYKDDKSVFSCDGYNNNPINLEDAKSSYFKVSRAKSFKPWLWATWIDRWESIKDNWAFDYNPLIRDAKVVCEGASWDVRVKKALRGDRYRIHPIVSRCKNIGEIGCHTTSPAWHKDKHHIDIWAGDIINQDGNFEE